MAQTDHNFTIIVAYGRQSQCQFERHRISFDRRFLRNQEKTKNTANNVIDASACRICLPRDEFHSRTTINNLLLVI